MESQNDNIHSKLKQLLESNREIRKEMATLGISQQQNQQSSNIESELPQLHRLHIQNNSNSSMPNAQVDEKSKSNNQKNNKSTPNKDSNHNKITNTSNSNESKNSKK